MKILLAFLLLSALCMAQTHTRSSNITSPKINSVLWVDGVTYADIAAAETAAGSTNPTIIVVPSTYAGTDCPTAQTNVIVMDYRAAGRTGSGTSTFTACNENAVTYGEKTSGLTDSLIKTQMQRTAVDATGSIVSGYFLTWLTNATVTGGVVDGISSQSVVSGTLSGTLTSIDGNEMVSDVQSTGGTVTLADGGQGYVASSVGSTTAITTVRGLDGIGCQISGASPTNCYGLWGRNQNSEGSARSYTIGLDGLGLLLWNSHDNAGGLDCEDNSHVVHPCFKIGATGGLIIQPPTTVGITLSTSDGAGRVTYTTSGFKVTTIPLQFTSSLAETNLLISATAPTISSGFGTSPSILSNNGTATFRIDVGTGGTANTGVIGMPTAAAGWNCQFTDMSTHSNFTQQTASTTTTVSIGGFNSAGTATAWTASDTLIANCAAY